jgi:phenylalanyl-tRNA synthetase beta subunit
MTIIDFWLCVTAAVVISGVVSGIFIGALYRKIESEFELHEEKCHNIQHKANDHIMIK